MEPMTHQDPRRWISIIAAGAFPLWLAIGPMLAGCSKTNPAQPITGDTTSTRVDTLSSIASLDGQIHNAYQHGSWHLMAGTAETELWVGNLWDWTLDHGEILMRSYVSFDISGLPDTVYAASLQLYQFESEGNSVNGAFPDSLGNCLVDHIDFGDSLETTDWTKGDSGNPSTLSCQYGLISSSPDTGWRQLDVTSCIRADKTAGRARSQFRVRFPRESDVDGLDDCLKFHSGGAASRQPRIVVRSKRTS
jgi:hypothetical protein